MMGKPKKSFFHDIKLQAREASVAHLLEPRPSIDSSVAPTRTALSNDNLRKSGNTADKLRERDN